MLSPHPLTETRRRLTGTAGSRRWQGVCLAFVFLLATLSAVFSAPKEHEVKAEFLFNFAKFVEWPSRAYGDDSAPVVIGIVGENPFGDTLQQIVQGQTAQGRRIEIRHFGAQDDFGNCHVLFLSRSVAAQTNEILTRLQGRPVLTVSEKEDFAQQGGVIGFALVDKTVRFDISAAAMEKAGLKASSKLLAVARSVLKSP